jgi:hypothetical protein
MLPLVHANVPLLKVQLLVPSNAPTNSRCAFTQQELDPLPPHLANSICKRCLRIVQADLSFAFTAAQGWLEPIAARLSSSAAATPTPASTKAAAASSPPLAPLSSLDFWLDHLDLNAQVDASPVPASPSMQRRRLQYPANDPAALPDLSASSSMASTAPAQRTLPPTPLLSARWLCSDLGLTAPDPIPRSAAQLADDDDVPVHTLALPFHATPLRLRDPRLLAPWLLPSSSLSALALQTHMQVACHARCFLRTLITPRLAAASADDPGSLHQLISNHTHAQSLLTHTGIAAMHVLAGLFEAIPRARDLLVCVKCVLAAHQQHKAYGGGMGSYVCAVLCVAFMLKRSSAHPVHCDPPPHGFSAHGEAEGPSLPQLLLEFLYFYGVLFNARTVGIALQSPLVFYPLDLDVDVEEHVDSAPAQGRTHEASASSSMMEEAPLPPRPALPALVVHDLVVGETVVSSACFNFPAIQAVFASALKTLLADGALSAVVGDVMSAMQSR